MDAAICREYGSSLADLKINSKPHINMLTMLAEENIEHASHIVRLIEARLQKAPATEKLPVMYLMDSIVKNVKKGPYQQLFAKNLTNNFCGVFAKVDEKTRASLFKLRSTWNQYFASGILHGLDVRVQKIDPAWPIMASAAAPSASIHINPKFIKKPAPMESTTITTTTTVPPTTGASPSTQLTEKERLEQEMRQSLISKQQELLQIQQQRLELELQQTKAKLEAQTKELAVKNEAIAQQQIQLSQMSAQQAPATSSAAPPALPSVSLPAAAPPSVAPPSVLLPPGAMTAGAISTGTLPSGTLLSGALPSGALPTSIADPTNNLALATRLLKQGGIQGVVPAGAGILGTMPKQHQQPTPGPQAGILGVSPHIRPSAPPPLIPVSGGPPTGMPSVMEPVPSDPVSSMEGTTGAATSDPQISHAGMPTPQPRDPRRAANTSRDPRLARDPRLRQAIEQQQQQKQQQEQLLILQQRKQQMKQHEQQQQQGFTNISGPAAPFSSPQTCGAEPQVALVVTAGNIAVEMMTSSGSTTSAAPTLAVQSSASITPPPVKSTASSRASDMQKLPGAESKKPSGVQKSSDSGAQKKKSPIKGKAPAPKSSKTSVKLDHLDLSSKEKSKEENLNEKETKETRKPSAKNDKVVEKAVERDATKRGLRSSTRNYRKTVHNEKEEKGRSDSRTSKRLPSSESASGSESQPRSRSRSPHSGSRSPRSSERGDRERRSGKSTSKEDSRRKESKENKPDIKTEKRKSPSPERLDEDKSLLKKYSKPDQLPPKKRARLIEREQQKAERDRENQIHRDRSARERAAGWERSSSREYEAHHPHGQHPYGQRPPHRRPSLVDPNVTIPQELSLNKLAEVLKQADKQLHSGALSHEQHQQLLRELNEIYKIHHRKREEEQHRRPHPPHFPRRGFPPHDGRDPRITRAQDPRGPRDPRDPRPYREMHNHPDMPDPRGPPDMRNIYQRDPRDTVDSRDFHDLREHPDTDIYRKEEYPKRRTLLEDPRMRSFPAERRLEEDAERDRRNLRDEEKEDSLRKEDFRKTSDEGGLDVDERKPGVFRPYNGPIQHGHPFAQADTDDRDVHLFTMRSDHGDLDLRKLPPGRQFDTDDRMLPAVFHADSKKEAVFSDTDERKNLQSGDSNNSRALDDSAAISEKLVKNTSEERKEVDTVIHEGSDVGMQSESQRKDVKDERLMKEIETDTGDTVKANKQEDSKVEQDIDMRQISDSKKESKMEQVGSITSTFTEELKQMSDLNQIKEKNTSSSELKEKKSDRDERPKAGETPAESEERKRDTDDRKLVTGLDESSNPDVELPAGDVDLRHPVEGQERFDENDRQNMEQRAAPTESQDIAQLPGPLKPHLQGHIPEREQIPRNGPFCGQRPVLRQFSGGMSNRWQQWKKDHPDEVCAPHNEGDFEGMDPRDPRYARHRRSLRVSREGERHLLEHPHGRQENMPPFEHRDQSWKDEHFSGPHYRQQDDIASQPRDKPRNEPGRPRGHPPMHLRMKQRGDSLLETPHSQDEGDMMDHRDDFPPHLDSRNAEFEEFQRRDRWSSRRGNRQEFLPDRGPRDRHPDTQSPIMEDQERERGGPLERRDEAMFLRGKRHHEDLDIEKRGPPGFDNRRGGPQFHHPDGPPFQPGDRPDYRGSIDPESEGPRHTVSGRPESQRRNRHKERRHMRQGGQDEQRHMGPQGPDNHGPIGPEVPEGPRYMGPGGPENQRHIHPDEPEGPRLMGPGGPDNPRFMGPVGSEGPRHMGPGGSDGPRFMGPEPPRHMGPGGPDFPRFMGPGGPDGSRFVGPGRPDGPRHMGPGGPDGPRHMGPRHGIQGGLDGPRHMGPRGPDGPRHIGPGGPDSARHQGFQGIQGPDGNIPGMGNQLNPTSVNPPSSVQGPINGSGGNVPAQLLPNLGNLQQIVQNVSQQVVKQMQQQMLSSNPQLMTHVNSPNLLQAALHNLGVRGNVPSNILQAAQQSLLQKLQSMPGMNMVNRLRPGAPNFPNQGGIERQPHPQGPMQPPQEMFDQQGGPSGMSQRPPFPKGVIPPDSTQQGGMPPDMSHGFPPGFPPGMRPQGIMPNSMPQGNMGPPLQPEVQPPQGMPPHSMPQGAVGPQGPADMQRPNLGMMPPMGMMPGSQGPPGPNLGMMQGGPGVSQHAMMVPPQGAPQGPPGMHPGGPLGVRQDEPPAVMNAAPNMEQGFRPPQEGTQSLAPQSSVTTQVDINSLFSKLIASGIIKGPAKSDSPRPEGSGTPPPPSAPQNKEGEKESTSKEDPVEIPDVEDHGSYDIPEINLTLEDLKPRYPGVVKRMYSGMQCTSCGQRFVMAQMDRYRKHLDWHFRQNRKKQDGNKATTSRKWFYEVDEWLDYEEINDMEDARSTFFDEQAQELAERGQGAASVPVTSDPSDEYCKICREQFEQFFDEETEEWHLRDAVRVEGRTFHPSCYDDVKDTSGFLETPTDELHSPPFVRTRNISFSGVPVSPGASFSSQQPLFPHPLGAGADSLPFPTNAEGDSTITKPDAGATPMETEQAGEIEGPHSTEGGSAANTDVKVKVKVEPEEPVEVGPDMEGARVKEMPQVKTEPEEMQTAQSQVPTIKAEVPEVKSETAAVPAEQGPSSVEGSVAKDEPGATSSTQLVKTEMPLSGSDSVSKAQSIEVVVGGKSFPPPDSKKLPPPLAEAVASLRESKEACEPPVLEAVVPLASSSPGREKGLGQSTSTGIFEKLTPPPALANMEGNGSDEAKDSVKETSLTQPPEAPVTKETQERGNRDPAAEGAAKGAGDQEAAPSSSSTSEGTNPPTGPSAENA